MKCSSTLWKNYGKYFKISTTQIFSLHAKHYTYFILSEFKFTDKHLTNNRQKDLNCSETFIF